MAPIIRPNVGKRREEPKKVAKPAIVPPGAVPPADVIRKPPTVEKEALKPIEKVKVVIIKSPREEKLEVSADLALKPTVLEKNDSRRSRIAAVSQDRKQNLKFAPKTVKNTSQKAIVRQCVNCKVLFDVGHVCTKC